MLLSKGSDEVALKCHIVKAKYIEGVSLVNDSYIVPDVVVKGK